MGNAMGGLLLAAAVCLELAAADGARAADDAARPNVVLITVDTLRADHVGAYGHHNDTTPALDRLAAAGVRFNDATVQWPQTWPSIASMMTSTYPATTGVRYSPRRPLADGQTTLAETLRAAGYQTAAVVANATIGRKFAFDQGFEVFVESWLDELRKRTGHSVLDNQAGKVKELTNATVVTDQALAVIERFERGKPFFLWLHYIDPHGPYVPPPAYAGMFAGSYPAHPVDHRLLPSYQLQKAAGSDLVIDDLGFYKAQYDRSVRYFDDQLSRLLQAPPLASGSPGTLVVVTADHGEGLGEHDYYLEHGAVPYQTTARVPLLMVLEGRLPAGRVVDRPVGVIGIAPTVLEILGLPAPSGFEGDSLMPLVGGGADAPAHVFMESGRRQLSQVTVRRGPWKLVHTRSPADRRRFGLPELALYNLGADPSEKMNVIGRHRETAAEMRAAMDTWLANGSRQAKRDAPPPKVDPATKEVMRALGYGG
jgi:arylsulfatase A-like enzyme